jgi:hypothetical protein
MMREVRRREGEKEERKEQRTHPTVTLFSLSFSHV